MGQRAGCLNSSGRGAHLFTSGFFLPGLIRFELEDLPPLTNYLPFVSVAAQGGTQVVYRDNSARGSCIVNVTNGEAATLVF